MLDIPGPPPMGNGNLDDIAAAGGLHIFQLRLHEEYGDVARFWLPDLELVSVADPVLLEPTSKINERPDSLFEFLAPLCEAGNLQTLPGEEQMSWRRLLLTVLAGRASHEAYFGTFTALAGALADRWAARTGPVELQRDLSELSLLMICEYALGRGLGAERSARVVASFETVLSEYLGRMYRPSATEAEERERLARADKALRYLRATVDLVLDAHRRSAGGGRSDLIATLADAGVRPARIRDTVLMIMLAAHHTTGVSVSWTLHLLARHPEVADRVAADLDRVLGDRAAPSYTDLKRLPYLEMVLKEAMRIYTPGPYGAREATEDTELGEYHVPAGTAIFYPFWAVHMNPRYWPEPRRFDPERFSPERSAGRHRLAYIPFGIGPRSCEGASLAMLEAQLVLAILLKRFRFTPVEGHAVTTVERFVLWAEKDIAMHVTPRA